MLMLSVEQTEAQGQYQDEVLNVLAKTGEEGVVIFSRREPTIAHAPGSRQSIDLSKTDPHVAGRQFFDAVQELAQIGLSPDTAHEILGAGDTLGEDHRFSDGTRQTGNGDRRRGGMSDDRNEKVLIRDGRMISEEQLRAEWRVEQTLAELEGRGSRPREHDGPAGRDVENPKLMIEVEVGEDPAEGKRLPEAHGRGGPGAPHTPGARQAPMVMNRQRIAYSMLALSYLSEQELQHVLMNLEIARSIALDFNCEGLGDLEGEEAVEAVVGEIDDDLDDLLGQDEHDRAPQ